MLFTTRSTLHIRCNGIYRNLGNRVGNNYPLKLHSVFKYSFGYSHSSGWPRKWRFRLSTFEIFGLSCHSTTWPILRINTYVIYQSLANRLENNYPLKFYLIFNYSYRYSDSPPSWAKNHMYLDMLQATSFEDETNTSASFTIMSCDIRIESVESLLQFYNKIWREPVV